MNTLHIIKIGGNVIDSEQDLAAFLTDLSKIQGPKLLVHGGGKLATALSKKLEIPSQLVDGRRITDAETLKVVTMVYAGWINKHIVAQLQGLGTNAIGLSGADGHCIRSTRRQAQQIDYGFVGDVSAEGVNTTFFASLLQQGIVPVLSAITCDAQGQLLNTNADTLASVLAIALSKHYTVSLVYCFEKKGVLRDKDNNDSVITSIDPAEYITLKAQGIVNEGMLPKLDNAFAARQQGAGSVVLAHAADLLSILQLQTHAGTHITL